MSTNSCLPSERLCVPHANDTDEYEEYEEQTLRTLGIKFLHPGPEHGPDTKGGDIRSWNRGPHHRKFMTGAGTVLARPESKPTRARFTFWGEWEPPSHLCPTTDHSTGFPHWLHTPFMAEPPVVDDSVQTGRPQNTDPFVFGDRFRFTICQQYKQAKGQPGHYQPTALHGLESGSVILFGSCVNGGFALDTVFVVDHDSFLWNDASRPQSLDGDAGEMYRTATIDRLRPGHLSLRHYSGVPYHRRNEFNGMFSFVPCLPSATGEETFSRPIITGHGIAPNHTQGYQILARDGENCTALWQAVVEQVLAQPEDPARSRLALAVHIDLPVWGGDRHSDAPAMRSVTGSVC